jgi:hypothetical protein
MQQGQLRVQAALHQGDALAHGLQGGVRAIDGDGQGLGVFVHIGLS